MIVRASLLDQEGMVCYLGGARSTEESMRGYGKTGCRLAYEPPSEQDLHICDQK